MTATPIELRRLEYRVTRSNTVTKQYAATSRGVTKEIRTSPVSISELFSCSRRVSHLVTHPAVPRTCQGTMQFEHISMTVSDDQLLLLGTELIINVGLHSTSNACKVFHDEVMIIIADIWLEQMLKHLLYFISTWDDKAQVEKGLNVG